MNNVTLRGTIQHIEPSHVIGDVQYMKAEVVCDNASAEPDVINIKFKNNGADIHEGETRTINGNIRSYSKRSSEGNHCEIYVFSHLDDSDDSEYSNRVMLDGRVCKVDVERKRADGTRTKHFILANNMVVSATAQKLNSYIPCILCDDLIDVVHDLAVNKSLVLQGYLHSRKYTKVLSSGETHEGVAHEVVVTEVL